MADQVQQLPTREEVPLDKTWRLEDIFPIDEQWQQELDAVRNMLSAFQDYNGKLNESAQNVYEILMLQSHVSERIEKLYTYAHMRYDQDTTNSLYQALNAKAETLITQATSAMSFIVPELLSMDEERLKQFIEEKEELKQFEHTLDEINRQRPHVLSEKEEILLAEAGEVMANPAQTFGMLNNADLKFPILKDEEGNDVELTHGRYMKFMESNNRSVREAAFKAMYETYGSFQNTFSSTLTGAVKRHNFSAKVRNYQSARQAALDKNNIPEQVYDNLTEAINDRLSLLHRYIKLRKRVLELDELHMYDLYTPLVKDVEMKIPYEQAQEHVLKGLAPLGDEYVNIIKEGYKNRWIDVEENKGKRSGAYSSGAYGTNPYILMNWQDNLNNVFTLAHELGHSLHSYYTRKHQPYQYGDYSIFVAEVASTCNEALLNDYMIENSESPKQKLYLLNHFLEGFRGTVFRQTMFAEFEHDIHLRMQEGEALTAEKLTELYYRLNQKYFGSEIVIDEEIGLEWARIPHFYYNYYVYQYATGYAAATSLASQIQKEGQPAVDRYLEFLKAGSSDYPIEVLKQAGVDMTEKDPIMSALDVFEEKLNEMERLLREVE